MRVAPRICLLALVAAWPAAARGQAPGWNVASIHATREALQRMERRYEAAAESPAYSEALRAEARAEAARLRDRLAAGDFQVGDRVFLSVERDTALTDTFTVEQGPVLQLPALGSVSLQGVLRSEVEAHLRGFVSRYVRDAVVRARSFVRVGVAGEVTSPGFYLVPTDLVLTDALRVAGGVTADGEISSISIRRNDLELWDALSLTEAVGQGRTIDQLDLRTGDQIIVGRRRGGFGFGGLDAPLRTISILFAIPLTIAGVVTLF